MTNYWEDAALIGKQSRKNDEQLRKIAIKLVDQGEWSYTEYKEYCKKLNLNI
jgi:hypothetical protein